MGKVNLDQIVAQLRSAEAASDDARRQRDEAVVKMARVEGLNNREIAARFELTGSAILKKGAASGRQEAGPGLVQRAEAAASSLTSDAPYAPGNRGLRKAKWLNRRSSSSSAGPIRKERCSSGGRWAVTAFRCPKLGGGGSKRKATKKGGPKSARRSSSKP
jgi:hypothetical protein